MVVRVFLGRVSCHKKANPRLRLPLITVSLARVLAGRGEWDGGSKPGLGWGAAG